MSRMCCDKVMYERTMYGRVVVKVVPSQVRPTLDMSCKVRRLQNQHGNNEAVDLWHPLHRSTAPQR